MGEKNQSIAKGTIRQILLITDGCSNLGGDPVEIAHQARQKQIVVNVIGIVDKGDLGRAGKEEILSISDAGGGMCRVVQSSELSATAQMMTHQTMQMTLQQVVNQELMEAMGKSADDLAPTERARVARVMDKLEEELRLELVLAVDTSASMKDKMEMVREAIRDLSLSLEARLGETEVAVIAFPGRSGEEAEVIQPFTTELDVTQLEGKLTARGGTPTAPALKEAVRLFAEVRLAKKTNQDEPAGKDAASAWMEDDLPAHRWDGSSPAS